MRLNLDDLPRDTALLHQLVRDLVAEKDQRDSEIDKLRLIIKQLQRGQFGRRSERLDPEQLHLSLEDLDADIARANRAKSACRVRRQSRRRSHIASPSRSIYPGKRSPSTLMTGCAATAVAPFMRLA